MANRIKYKVFDYVNIEHHSNEEVEKRFKGLEKLILPFLYNLQKSDEPYIHWPNRQPIIKAQIENILKLTRGK